MKSIFRMSALAGLFLGSSLPIAPALAQSATNDPPQTNPSSTPATRGWVATLGAGAEYGPDYQGATDQSFSFVPYLDIRRFGEPAEPDEPDDNFDLTLLTWKGLEVGPVVG